MSCLTNWGAKSVSQADAAVLQEAVDREPFQQIDAITSRSQSPTFATKSALIGQTNRAHVCLLLGDSGHAINFRSTRPSTTLAD